MSGASISMRRSQLAADGPTWRAVAGGFYALFGARSACNMNPRSLKHLPYFLGMLAIEAPEQCWNTYTYSRLMDFLTTKKGSQHSVVAFFIVTAFPSRFDSARYPDNVLF